MRAIPTSSGPPLKSVSLQEVLNKLLHYPALVHPIFHC